MKAARVLRFGPPNVITNEDVPKPEPREFAHMVVDDASRFALGEVLPDECSGTTIAFGGAQCAA
jgi:hypothetical protein